MFYTNVHSHGCGVTGGRAMATADTVAAAPVGSLKFSMSDIVYQIQNDVLFPIIIATKHVLLLRSFSLTANDIHQRLCLLSLLNNSG